MDKYEAEAERLRRVYDAHSHKYAVQNLYTDVSAMLDRLDKREGWATGGRDLFIAVDALCHKLRNA